MDAHRLVMGAVAYDPKVVTIWHGFRSWLRRHSLPFDFVLYSNYERQVEDLAVGQINAAWNSPLAWIRAQRLAAAQNQHVRALTMRDTDCDLTSVVVVRADSTISTLEDLAGQTIATGALDSPQATLIPLSHLQGLGLRPNEDVKVRRFDVGIGLHGNHVGGERDAARALGAGEVAAACMTDSNHLLFTREGTLTPGSTRVLTVTKSYDHCNMTVRTDVQDELIEQFNLLLLDMSYSDPELRPLLEMEGLTTWRPGRTNGYGALEAAVDQAGFYDLGGQISATGYDP
jgi:phosphonate transport system substrate-binding protein